MRQHAAPRVVLCALAAVLGALAAPLVQAGPRSRPPAAGLAAPHALPPGGSPLPGIPPHGALPGADPGERLRSLDLQQFASSVVRVQARIVDEGRTVDTMGRARVGSGVLIDRQTVLTIGYLVAEAEDVEIVTASGRKVPAAVAGFDHGSGFGVLRALVPLDGKPLPLGDSDRVGEREPVLTIGHGEPEATPLVVLSRRPFAGGWEWMVERPLMTFPPVNNWSGSALVSTRGELIGIGSLILDDATSSSGGGHGSLGASPSGGLGGRRSEGMGGQPGSDPGEPAAGAGGVPGNLFVPINAIKPILADLLARGRRAGPAQPWLGMTTETIGGNLMVTRVAPGGPAESAGVVPGDIVLGIGPDRPADLVDFYRRVWRLGPAGTQVPLRVLHAGDVRDVEIRSIDRNDWLRKPAGI